MTCAKALKVKSKRCTWRTQCISELVGCKVYMSKCQSQEATKAGKGPIHKNRVTIVFNLTQYNAQFVAEGTSLEK